MNWCVIRHPETGGLAAVAESSLPHHRGRGWIRVSDLRVDPVTFDLDEYAEAPDLDAAPAAEATTPAEATFGTSGTAAGDPPAEPSMISKEKAR